jgi:glycosyltransferase involved in cell wall biosynthesis
VTAPIRVLELRSVWGTGGGPEKTILLGAAQADRARFDVTVCYIRDDRDTVYGIDDRASALPVQYVEIREKHSFDRAVIGKLRALIRERSIDIVHAHDYKTDALTWWLGRSMPFVPFTTAHGWTGHSAKERHVYYPLDRWLIARHPRAIAVSSEIKQTLVSAGARAHRIDVVLNAIDPQAFVRDRARDASARAALQLPPATRVIGAVGRLEPQKNFPLLIDVFARIARDLPDTMLVIAGDGSARETLARQVQATGLESRLRLLGHQSDVTRVHHALDLFVQSSDYEGTPNAVLEAMAFENPIIATAAGGTAEIARDRQEAWIVACGDGAGLEASIRQALRDPGAARMRARNARTRVEGELSFQARMARVESIYTDLVARYPAVSSGRRVPASEMQP